jgi:rhamnose transport system permease protein
MSVLGRLRPRLSGWELFLLVLLVGTLVVGALSSPFFFTASNFAVGASDFMEIAVMALGMTLIIVAREIDLSVASVLGLGSVVLGATTSAGLPLGLSVLAVLATGAVAGAFNGLLITRIGLSSIVVTIGTLGLYRGLAYGIYGSRAESEFPTAILDLGAGTIPGTEIPWSLALFAMLALATGVVLHRSYIGRQIYALGLNPEAADFSGIRVARIKLALFTFSGVLAAVAALIYTGRVSTARADNGLGLELEVIAAVLLGGVSIFGGRGSLTGVVLGLLLIGTLRNLFSLHNIGTDVEMLVVGGLMISAVVLPQSVASARTAWRRRRARRGPTAGDAPSSAIQAPVP